MKNKSPKEEVKTRIIKIEAGVSEKELIKLLTPAAKALANGKLVAFPTETVYGLGANALNAQAVLKIFEAKNRPADNPLIVHISRLKQLKLVAKDIPEVAKKLIHHFWPGPLTLILPKANSVPSQTTGGKPTVAVRMPDHKVALKLIELARVPIAAPSANLSGKPSPTDAQDVIEDLYGKVDFIIDAGSTPIGVESTVVDVTSSPPLVLRPGGLSVEDLHGVAPTLTLATRKSDLAKSPGTRYRHYAPQTPLWLITTSNYVQRINNLIQNLQKQGKTVVVLATKQTQKAYPQAWAVLNLGDRNKPLEVSSNLFRKLREADRLNADIILAEPFEEKHLGLAIMNRLKRAASKIVN